MKQKETVREYKRIIKWQNAEEKYENSDKESIKAMHVKEGQEAANARKEKVMDKKNKPKRE